MEQLPTSHSQDPSQQDFVYISQGHGPIDSEMFRKSYEALPDKQGLAEVCLKNQSMTLDLPPFPPAGERAQNPLNRPELGINGNVVMVIGLPGATNDKGKWMRHEIAFIDFGPEAETNPVPAYSLPGLEGGRTLRGYRYGFVPYNYCPRGFRASYAPVPSGKPHMVGHEERGSDIVRYTRTMLGLNWDDADLRNISPEQLVLTVEGNQVTIEDTSSLRFGTDVVYPSESSTEK